MAHAGPMGGAGVYLVRLRLRLRLRLRVRVRLRLRLRLRLRVKLRVRWAGHGRCAHHAHGERRWRGDVGEI